MDGKVRDPKALSLVERAERAREKARAAGKIRPEPIAAPGVRAEPQLFEADDLDSAA